MTAKHYLFAYGSLLSDDSRKRFSDIHDEPVAVEIQGWKRAWITRSEPEQQTYVGARPQHNSTVNGMLLPIDAIDDNLRTREQDYHFARVDLDDIRFVHGNAGKAPAPDVPIWICHTRYENASSESHPVYQSYLDTCLAGCLETVGESFARDFLHNTQGLTANWHNDRHGPVYPRAARVSDATLQSIDRLLDSLGLLVHRKELK